MQAVILAGGAGMRLRPLTLNIPKSMVDVNGKPFLLYVVRQLKKSGVRDFVFCLGHLAQQFKDFFGDGSSFGVKITYSVEKKFMGTGGALKLAQRHLKDGFFVVNGDTYLPLGYAAVYKAFKRVHKIAMAVVYDNHKKIAEPNMVVDKGLVRTYVKREEKKTTAAKCRFVDAGVQVFNKSVLKLIPAKRFVSLEMDVFPKLIARQELAAHVVSQRYYDMGTPQRLRLIRRVLK